MPITWDEFDRMFASVKDGLADLRALAREHDPSQRDKYEALAKRLIATCRNITSSTGQFTPPISQAASRERWQDIRRESKAIANLIRTDRSAGGKGNNCFVR